MQFLTNIDLNKNELQNARIQNLAVAPGNPSTGQIYFNSVDKKYYGWDSSSWIDLGQVLTGASIVTLINASTSKIDDDNLSALVNDAITKRHSHSNAGILDAITAAFTTALNTKLTGIADGATKTENSGTNGNIKINGVEQVVYTHPGTGTNPHGTTKADVGLGNTENKSSSTIRDEITSSNVTTALGFTPVKNGGSVPEFRTGTEASRPTANGSGIVYFATDTKKIWKDTATGTWTQMGGQDTLDWSAISNKPSTFAPATHNHDDVYYTETEINTKLSGKSDTTHKHAYTELTSIPTEFNPVKASSTVLGGVKVGANLTVSADGTLNANDNPASFIRRQERITATEGQTIFDLTKGKYQPNSGSIWWYFDGVRQADAAMIETSPTIVTLPAGLPEGEVMFEWFEIINMNPFPIHSNEHLTGGADPIPLATPTADGLFSKADKDKLNKIADNANNYSHPTGDGNSHVPATGTGNNGKILKAGSTANSAAWGSLSAAEVGAVPTTDVVTSPSASKILKLDANSKLPASITGNADGNAATATKLQNGRTISATGDATGTSATFDGSGNASIPLTLANSGVTAGTYPKVTVDAKGRVTGGQSLIAGDIPTLTLAKLSDAGTAASKNTGTASGNVPILDSGGKLDVSILPALAISETYVVANQAAMLALTAEMGDIAVRTDLSKTFILKTEPATALANWQELLTPTDTVTSVAGKTGAVTLVKGDVGLSNVDNESKATMFTNAALTGTPTAPTAASTVNTTQIATTAYVKSQNYITSSGAPVQSVAGKTGAVTLANSDVGLGNVENKSSATIRGEITSSNVTTALGFTPIQKKAFNIGDATATSFVLTHNLNTQDITVTIRENATPYNVVFADVEITSVNTITVRFATAPTASQYRAVVVG